MHYVLYIMNLSYFTVLLIYMWYLRAVWGNDMSLSLEMSV